jgi:hypothetical protein
MGMSTLGFSVYKAGNANNGKDYRNRLLDIWSRLVSMSSAVAANNPFKNELGDMRAVGSVVANRLGTKVRSVVAVWLSLAVAAAADAAAVAADGLVSGPWRRRGIIWFRMQYA